MGPAQRPLHLLFLDESSADHLVGDGCSVKITSHTRNRTKPIAELDTILKILRDTGFDNPVIGQLCLDIPLVGMVERDVHDIVVPDLKAEIVYDITSDLSRNIGSLYRLRHAE